MSNPSRALRALFLGALCALVPSCEGEEEEVDSDAAARAAYYGLDGAIEKALNLGMDGYNAASSANIPDQTTTGDVSGTITVSGQVDQGSSDNKGMRLYVSLVDYQDDVPDDDLEIVYDTDDAALPYLELSLRNIPNGTLTGTLTGDFYMDGDIEGRVTLSLTFSGQIEPGDAGGDSLHRVEGTTTVTGTATSSYGTFDVNVTI